VRPGCRPARCRRRKVGWGPGSRPHCLLLGWDCGEILTRNTQQRGAGLGTRAACVAAVVVMLMMMLPTVVAVLDA
jgi:hypothetical protein